MALRQKQKERLLNGQGDKIVTEERGLTCPHCQSTSSTVYSTNKIDVINISKRYRKCNNCKMNFVSTVIHDKK